MTFLFTKLRSSIEPSQTGLAIGQPIFLGLRPYSLVFFGGINLILIQWVLVRELTAVLLGSELVILLVTVVYFIGLSVGYRVSHRIQRRWLAPLGIMTLLLHLSLPIWLRLMIAWFDSLNAYGLAFLLPLFIVPFVVSAFYSVFLPLFADSGQGHLPSLYAVEVLGSAVGVLSLVVLGGLGIVGVFTLYAVVMLGILWALKLNRVWLLLLAVWSTGWLVAFPALNNWSNTLWFQQIQGLPVGTATLFTGYSPYQKVDALETPAGARYLYLDGLEHFGSASGEWLNIMMGRIPASMTQPDNALVFGAGSMQMALMIANYSAHVTTVELDPMVANVSISFFAQYNFMDRLTNRTVIIDDAKHFIATTEQTYDLIATDLPGAFMIQTGALYTVPFYESVAQKLRPGGVFVVNLTSDFTPDALASRRIAASLLNVFDDVMIVTSRSAGWSFAYVSNDLPFSREDVQQAIEVAGETSFGVFETSAVRAIVGDARPLTLDSMDIVLQSSLDRVAKRLGWDE